MTVAVWSVKGGVGVTTVAALLAIAQVERAEPAVLIDLCGDVPALLGCVDLDDVETAAGVIEWCASVEPTGANLGRIEREIRSDLTVVPRGVGTLPEDATALIRVLGESARQTIVDCGVVGSDDTFAQQIVQRSCVDLLVVRECFLNLRAVQRSACRPSAVVVLKEQGRQLGRADIEAVTGAPVIAQLAVDPAIARSLDAGLASARLPRRLLRSMGAVPATAKELKTQPTIKTLPNAG